MEQNDNPALNAHNKQEYPPAHTAEHLLNQTMVRMFGCERSKNMHIERKKSKINYDLPSCPTEEQIREVERKMNELIAMDLPVTYELVGRDQLPEGIKLDRLPDDVRLSASYELATTISAPASAHTSIPLVKSALSASRALPTMMALLESSSR